MTTTTHGISESVRQQLLAAVGNDPDRVRTEQSDLLAYSDDITAIIEKGMPDVVVSPESVEEIRAILRIANAEKIPVIPVSAGMGLGTFLAREGGILIELSHMRRVLEVNRECLYVLIEPGVSYADLCDKLTSWGLAPSIPDAPPSVSVLANNTMFGMGGYAMEGIGPELVLGVEVVLPNGDVVRTGSASLEGIGWHARYSHDPMPDLTGLFVRSFGTLGVITKLALRVFPKPESVIYRKVGFERLDTAAEMICDLAQRGIIDRGSGFSWFFSGDATAALADRITGAPISPEELKEMRAAVKLPNFFFYLGVHGEARSSAVRAQILDEAVADTGATQLEMTPVDNDKYLSIANGRPQRVSEQTVLGRKGKYEGGYDSVVTYTPMSVWQEMYERWEPIAIQHGHPLAANMKLMTGGRFSSFRFIICYFNPGDMQDRYRITSMKNALIKATTELNVPTAAAPPDLFPKLSMYPLYRQIKATLDPNNIMHPSIGS